LISRHRGRFSLRQIRTRQVLIAAGIVAAHAAIVFIFRESGLDDAFAAVCITAFAVLILEGAARIRILQAWAAAMVRPTDRIPGLWLGIAVGCAFAAIVGHLWI